MQGTRSHPETQLRYFVNLPPFSEEGNQTNNIEHMGGVVLSGFIWSKIGAIGGLL
jgi:hypothetical protein